MFSRSICFLLFVILISCGKQEEKINNTFQKSVVISNLTKGYWMLEGLYDSCLMDNKYYFKEDYTLEVDYGNIDCIYDYGSLPYQFEPGYWYFDNKTFDLVFFTNDTIYKTTYFELIKEQNKTGVRMKVTNDSKGVWSSSFVYFSRFE